MNKLKLQIDVIDGAPVFVEATNLQIIDAAIEYYKNALMIKQMEKNMTETGLIPSPYQRFFDDLGSAPTK